jgi:hypothetical protein
VRRVSTLAGEIALVTDADRAQAEAPRSCPGDLLCLDGGRIPGTAGIMGRYRDRRHPESPGRREHYQPRGAGGPCPARAPARPGAGRRSTRWPAFAIGQKRAARRILRLRRAAIGTLRILVGRLNIDLRALVARGQLQPVTTPTVETDLGLRARTPACLSTGSGLGRPRRRRDKRCSTPCAGGQCHPWTARGRALVKFLALPRPPVSWRRQAHFQHPQEAGGGGSGTVDELLREPPRRRAEAVAALVQRRAR